MFLRSFRNILLIFIFITGLFLGITMAGQDLPFLGEINANNINLRSDATVSSKAIATLNQGERIDVVADSYEWYKIRLPSEVSVYLKGSFVDCVKYQEGGPELNKNTCLQAKVLNSRVNIRVSPDESAAIVGIANENEIVKVKGETKGWYKIEPTQNSFAWVHKKFISRAAINKVLLNKNAQRGDLIPEENIELKGKISPYGMVFRRVATHKLITSEHKIFLLKGDKATLNALNRSTVKVVGKIISPAKAKYPVVEVVTIEVAT